MNKYECGATVVAILAVMTAIITGFYFNAQTSKVAMENGYIQDARGKWIEPYNGRNGNFMLDRSEKD